MIIEIFDEAKNKKVVAGKLIDGVFYKEVIRAKHYLWVAKGYAIQQEAVDLLTGVCNSITIFEKDTGNILTISFQDFLTNSKKWRYSHGKQRTISEKFLKVVQ